MPASSATPPINPLPWITRSRRIVLDQRPWLCVENHTVELPGGRLIPDWPWVITPDYINVVAVTEAGEFLCFRQAKYGLDGPSLALVGGYLEPGEEPLAAAQRELLEETGCEAPDWTRLGDFLVDPNRGICTGHLFLARRLRQVALPQPGADLEEQELLRISRHELEQALAGGRFKVLAWAAAVAFALLSLNEPSSK